MAFDLDAIERALDVGIETATEVLAARERDFAGAPEIGGVPACAAWLTAVKAARAEFAKLRKAIEDAPRVKMNGAAFLCNRGKVGNANNITSMHLVETPPGFDHVHVLLVNCDE